MSQGRFFKRCGCRNDDGQRLNAACPELAKRSHGSWTCVVDVPGEDGKRRQLAKGGFRTKGDAEGWRDDILSATRKGARRIDPRLTVGVWLQRWLAEKTKPIGISGYGGTVRGNTAAGYRLHVGYLTEQIGDVLLSDLAVEHVTAAYEALANASEARAKATEEAQQLANAERVSKGREPVTYAPVKRLGPTSVLRIHACLRAALQAAVRTGHKSFNPCLQVTFDERPRPALGTWTGEQLGRFLDATRVHRMGTLFEVIAAAGLRRGEALGLRWSDFDELAQTLRIDRQLLNVWANGAPVFGDTKTASGHRTVALPTPTVDAVRLLALARDAERDRWRDGYEDHDLIFCQENGRPYDPAKVTKTFAALSAAAGLPHIRLHDLRHGTATRMLANNTPMATVSKLLGHSSIDITVDVYGHQDASAVRRAADAGWSDVKRTVSPM